MPVHWLHQIISCRSIKTPTLLFFRDLALDVLRREPAGSFLVRASHSRGSAGLALSVRVPPSVIVAQQHQGMGADSGIAHYLIVKSPRGFRIKVIETKSNINRLSFRSKIHYD